MSIFHKFFKQLSALCLLAMLSACVVPEQYEADIEITGDEVSVEFDGTLKEMVSVMQSGGRPVPQDDPQLKKMLAELVAGLRKLPGYTSVEVTDNNRIAAHLKDRREIGKNGYFYGLPQTNKPASRDNFLRLKRLENGEILITSAKLKAKDLAVLMETRYDPEGIIRISTDYEVLEHNAHDTPGWFSRAYVWQLDTSKALLDGVQMRLKKKE